jgi:hypothetical protein
MLSCSWKIDFQYINIINVVTSVSFGWKSSRKISHNRLIVQMDIYNKLYWSVVPLKTLILHLELFRLPDMEIGFMAGVTSQQGMLTPPSHLIPPLVYPKVRVCLFPKFIFPTGFMRLIQCSFFMLFYENDQLIYLRNDSSFLAD